MTTQNHNRCVNGLWVLGLVLLIIAVGVLRSPAPVSGGSGGGGTSLGPTYFDSYVQSFCTSHHITDQTIVDKINWGWSQVIKAGALPYIGDMELLYRDYNPATNLTWFGRQMTFNGYTLDDYGAVFTATTILRVDNMGYDYSTGAVFAAFCYPNSHTGKEVAFGFFNPTFYDGNYVYVNGTESHSVQRASTNAPAVGGTMTESNLVYSATPTGGFTYDPTDGGYNDYFDQSWTYSWSGTNCSVWHNASFGQMNFFNNQQIFTNALQGPTNPLTTFLAGSDLITNVNMPTIAWNAKAQLFIQLKNFPTGNFQTDSNIIVAINSLRLALSPMKIENNNWGDSRIGYGQHQITNSFVFYNQQKFNQPSESCINWSHSGAGFISVWNQTSSNYWFSIPYPPWILRNFNWEFGFNDFYFGGATPTSLKTAVDSFRFACVTNKANLYITTVWGAATNYVNYNSTIEAKISQFNFMLYSNAYLYTGFYPMDKIVNMRLLNTNNPYSDGVHFGDLLAPYTQQGYQVLQAWAECGPINSGFQLILDFDGNIVNGNTGLSITFGIQTNLVGPHGITVQFGQFGTLTNQTIY